MTVATEQYANDYTDKLAAAITSTVRPVTFDVVQGVPTVPATLQPPFRVRVENEYLLITSVTNGGIRFTGNTVEGSVAAVHPQNAVVDQVLTVAAMLNSPGPMTTLGDMVYMMPSGNPNRLPVGSAGQMLGIGSGNTPLWVPGGFPNPMTTAGDVIYGGTGGAPARIPRGATAGLVLQLGPAPDLIPGWGAAAGGGGGGADDADEVRTGSSGIIVPGFAGLAEIKPGSPSASDDEFETTSASLPVTGWTTGTQAPNAGDINTTSKSHLYLKSTAATDTIGHIFKAAPATPYTVIAKLTDHTLWGAAFSAIYVFIADANPPVKAVGVQLAAAQAPNAGANVQNVVARAVSYTSVGASPATGGADAGTRAVGFLCGGIFIKMVVTSASNISFYASYGGKLWVPIGLNINPGVGLANVGQVGIGVDAANVGTASLEALFDFIRFS